MRILQPFFLFPALVLLVSGSASVLHARPVAHTTGAVSANTATTAVSSPTAYHNDPAKLPVVPRRRLMRRLEPSDLRRKRKREDEAAQLAMEEQQRLESIRARLAAQEREALRLQSEQRRRDAQDIDDMHQFFDDLIR